MVKVGSVARSSAFDFIASTTACCCLHPKANQSSTENFLVHLTCLNIEVLGMKEMFTTAKVWSYLKGLPTSTIGFDVEE